MDGKLSNSGRYDTKSKNGNSLLNLSSYDILQEISYIQSGFLLSENNDEMLVFFECMLSLLLRATDSEYGFIGEVLYTNEEKPYLKAYAITNIAWDAPTRKLYEQSKKSGIEFRNLQTLFGEALVTKSVVIANNAPDDPRAGGTPHGHPKLETFLAIPFLAENNLIGLCGIANRKEGYDNNIVQALTPIVTSCTTLTIHYQLKRQKSEQERLLKESEELLRQTQKAARLGNWQWNVSDDIFTVTEYFAEIFGIEKRVLDDSIERILPYIHPNDLVLVQELIENASMLVKEVKEEFRIINDKGQIKYVRIIGILYQKENTKNIYFGSIQEITDEKLREENIKQSEQKLSSIFNALPDSFIIMDRDGTYLEIAPNHEEYLFRSKDELIGKKIGEFYDEARTEFLLGLIRKSLDENKPVSADYQLTVKGRQIWLNGICVPFRNDQVLFVARDVTYRKKDEITIEGINSILELIASGTEISTILEEIAHFVESIIPEMMASVLRYDKNKHCLHTSTAPSLPPEYSALIDGLAVAEGKGACGTAAHRKQSIIITDCYTDPLMNEFADILRNFSLQSIWSTPIIGKSNILLGTFALYSKKSVCPSQKDLEILSKVSRLVSIAIERDLEENLRTENENRYRNISELISDYAYSLGFENDGTFKTEWLIGNFSKIYGYTLEELTSLTDPHALIHPDDKAKLIARTANLLKGNDDEMELRIITKNGEIKWIKDSMKPTLDESKQKIVRIIGAAKDITESVKQNENLRLQAAMLNSVGQAVIATDKEGIIIYANNFTESLYGWKPEEILGKNILDVTPSENSYTVAKEIFAELVQGKSWSGEFESKHKNGQLILTFITDSPIFDDNNNLIGIIGVSQDISAQKNAEIEKQRILERVQLQNETLALIASSEYISNGNINDLCQLITEKVGASFDIERTGIWLFNDEITELHCIYQYTLSTKSVTGGAILYENEFFDEFQYLKVGKFVDANNPLTDPRTKGYVETYIKPNNITAMLDAVIRIGGRNLGTLCFEHVGKVHTWTPDEISFCNQLADQIGACLLNAEKNTAQKILKDSEERFFSTFKNAPIGLAIIEKTGKIVKVNSALCEILGYSHEELELLSINDVTHEEDIAFDYEHLESLIKGVKDTYRIEKRYYHKTGRIIWAQLSVSVVRGHSGNVEYVIGQVQDITEQRKIHNQIAEERERLAVTLRSIGDGVVTTDKNGIITFMNRVAEELTLWTNAEAVGKSFFEIFSLSDNDNGFSEINFLETILLKGRVFDIENNVTLNTREGKEISISDSAAPIRDRESNIIGVIVTFRDNTKEQKLMDIALKNSKLDSLAVLAGGIAHDFNNLLAGMFGYLEVAKIYINKGTYYKADSAITNAVSVFDRARALTQQLLTFAKGGDPVRKTGSIAQLLEKSLKFVFSGSSISYRLEMSEDLLHCDFDENQIGQVIDNIAINAMQAMSGTGSFTVKAYNRNLIGRVEPLQHKPSDYICIEFKDNGGGIPQSILPRIFDPFYTTKSTGHGLGLSTVHSIIQKHGGWIDVESEEGIGTVFFVYLPAKTGKSITEKQEVIKNITGTPSLKNILIMDDEDFLREILRDLLTEMGYSVTISSHGEEALSIYYSSIRNKTPFDVLFLDLTIPGGKGGKEVVSEIRRNDSNVKIVAFSGYSEDPIMTNPQKFGFNARLIKPFTHNQLETLLKKQL